MNFKIGDKVKCINNEDSSVLRQGATYTITTVHSPYLYLEGLAGGWYDWKFELVKEEKMTGLKVGDRVRCIQPPTGYDKETIYTVTGLYDDNKPLGDIYLDNSKISWSQSRFELVEDVVTVTMSVSEAKSNLRSYPDSKYMKPALEALDYPPVPFKASLYPMSSYPEHTVVVYDSMGEKATRVKDSSNEWWHNGSLWTVGDGSTVSTGDIVFVPQGASPTVSEITFDIPISVARTIGGCTVGPLVAKYDEEHAPKFDPADVKVGDRITLEQMKTLPKKWILMPENQTVQAMVTTGNSIKINRAWAEGAEEDWEVYYHTFIVLWKPK